MLAEGERNPQFEIDRAAMKVGAASTFYSARMMDFDAALMVATEAELELARQGAIGALEALLDAKLLHTTLMFNAMGTNPRM